MADDPGVIAATIPFIVITVTEVGHAAPGPNRQDVAVSETLDLNIKQGRHGVEVLMLYGALFPFRYGYK